MIVRLVQCGCGSIFHHRFGQSIGLLTGCHVNMAQDAGSLGRVVLLKILVACGQRHEITRTNIYNRHCQAYGVSDEYVRIDAPLISPSIAQCGVVTTREPVG